MNTKDFISLLNKPQAINDTQTAALEYILSEFPFLQSARAIYLKGLYNQDSFRYNFELKKTAAYTTDRSVLFDFITSETFIGLQNTYSEKNNKAIDEIIVVESEIVEPINKLEESIKSTIKEATQNVQQEVIEATKKLEIGKPLPFVKEEKHSFTEWLELSKPKIINRENENSAIETKSEVTKNKKMDLIDKFIETNPKIKPSKSTATNTVNSIPDNKDTSYLMTETLAKVYLEQKKYQKAIQAYEILILKYPEKNAFFADRILDIKILQQNNN